MNICDKTKCTGCMACYNACPKHCISMQYDKNGTLMPYIDEQVCIKCGICSRTCPANKQTSLHTPLDVYACWDLDEEKRKQSASGGIASVFYEHILKNNGVVFGCHYHQDLQLQFSYATTIDAIEPYKTSKYSQAYIGDAFQKVRSFLKASQKVLFIGTPCQIAGLKSFLKEDDEHLITVDLICHGVPSQKYIDAYIDSLHLKGTPTHLTFRGLYNFYLTIYEHSKILYSKKSDKDLYFSAFLNGLFYRESCYQCPYATSNRIADITIGDFWGLGTKEKFMYDTTNGVSLMMINTQKGQALFENIKEKIFFEKRTLIEAKEGNAQLNHPSIKHKDYAKFQELYQQYGFTYALHTILLPEIN